MKLNKASAFLLAGVMTLSLGTFVSASINSENNLPIDNYASSEEQVNTLDKGYQIIDGDIYDKYGVLLIDMENGLTPEGYTLSPDFEVVYPEDLNNEPEKISKLRITSVFNGTKYLNKNITGNEGVQVGSNFSFSSFERDFYLKYSSGPSNVGLNVSLINVTTGSCVTWFSNMQANTSNTYSGAYNPSRPNDVFKVMGSGQGGSGNFTIVAKKQ